MQRLNKFIASSGFCSRRKADEYIENGDVVVNGRIVKASYDVKVGDIIEIKMGEKTVKAEVLEILEHVLKNDAALMYKIL